MATKRRTEPLTPRTSAARVTVKDVAKLAGVSLGTVSNALNRPTLVAPDTLAKVQAAVDQLGFVRNSAAHQLRGGRSNSFGAIVVDASNPHVAAAIRGLEDAIHTRGASLVVCSSDGSADRERRYLQMLEEQRVQGIVITPVDRGVRRLEALRERGTAVVLLDHASAAGDFCSASVDHALGSELSARHLFDRGHRRIAFVNGPLNLRQCSARRRGARRAAATAGLNPDDAIVELNLTSISALGEVPALIEKVCAAPRGERASAVLCLDDAVALVVLRVLAEHRLRVPRDISVIGYDDVAYAALLAPALTSVRQPTYELGQAAGQLLVAEIHDGYHVHQHLNFQPELILRESDSARARLNRYDPRGG